MNFGSDKFANSNGTSEFHTERPYPSTLLLVNFVQLSLHNAQLPFTSAVLQTGYSYECCRQDSNSNSRVRKSSAKLVLGGLVFILGVAVAYGAYGATDQPNPSWGWRVCGVVCYSNGTSEFHTERPYPSTLLLVNFVQLSLHNAQLPFTSAVLQTGYSYECCRQDSNSNSRVRKSSAKLVLGGLVFILGVAVAYGAYGATGPTKSIVGMAGLRCRLLGGDVRAGRIWHPPSNRLLEFY